MSDARSKYEWVQHYMVAIGFDVGRSAFGSNYVEVEVSTAPAALIVKLQAAAVAAGEDEWSVIVDTTTEDGRGVLIVSVGARDCDGE